jgi:hypothetical protein
LPARHSERFDQSEPLSTGIPHLLIKTYLIVVVAEVTATKFIAAPELSAVALTHLSAFAFAGVHRGERRDQAVQGGFAAVGTDRVG